MSDWKKERVHTIRTRQGLPVSFSLSEEEKAFFHEQAKSGSEFGFAVTPYYFSLLSDEFDDPLRAQCIPKQAELQQMPYEEQDPLFEDQFSPLPRMVHRYSDRILVLVTDECALYCRHCFRRYFASRRSGVLTGTQIKDIAGYLREHPEVHEVILSGGDPLVLPDTQISDILTGISSGINRPLVIRMATRIPVVLPRRITAELISILTTPQTLFVITQFNHPREITAESSRAVKDLVSAGIPVMNQTVLLKGVNDNTDVLAQLFQGLLDIRVKPYYLFQGDLAAGTSHFRVPLSRGFDIMRELRRTISGLAMPVYAVDLPGGGGKIPLNENYLSHHADGWFTFIGPDGRQYRYPDESY